MAIPNYLTYAQWTDSSTRNADVVEATFNRFVGRASRMIDQITRWSRGCFASQSKTYYLDGSGTFELALPLPPITITSVSLVTARSPEVLEALDATTYLARVRQGDQSDPRIERYPRGVTWAEGQENYKVVGTFGWLDEDGVTPQEIRDVCERLVRLLVEAEADGDEWGRGHVQSFQTDQFSFTKARGGLKGGLTGRPDIEGVLAHYRRIPGGGAVFRTDAERGLDPDDGAVFLRP